MNDVGAGDQYANPPIQEALVEFVFQATPDWDLTVPGKLHQHPAIAPIYLGKPRTQPAAGVPMLGMGGGIGRVQLTNEDGTRVISLMGNAIAIHSIRPYEGWENFRPRIETALRAYVDVTGASEIVRIGVRYLNHIEIAEQPVELSKYFALPPQVLPGLPPMITAFYSRNEYAYEDGCKVIVAHTPVPATDVRFAAFMLDIDVIVDSGPARTVEQALEAVDLLHTREKQAFEALITDDARRLFDVPSNQVAH